MAKSPRLITPTAKRPISGKAIAKAVKAQGINTPYWTRVVGNRLEIQPVGGQVIEIPFGPSAKRPGVGKDRPETPVSAADFHRMKRDELRALALEMDIDGASNMLKAELVDAIVVTSS